MYALIDCRADNALLSGLEKHGYMPIKMPPADYLSQAVASHTDMLLFIGFGRLFCHARYYESNKELIDRIAELSGLALVLSREPTCEKYPRDVLFNACIIGNKLICNSKAVSLCILDAALGWGFELIDVPQGYTKCSICKVSEKAIITADKTIADACAAHGIKVLLISCGNVSLPPYDYGFLGVASGFCQNTVYFCGWLDSHPDGEMIKKFCTQNGAEAICLSNDTLQDVGTIFFI